MKVWVINDFTKEETTTTVVDSQKKAYLKCRGIIMNLQIGVDIYSFEERRGYLQDLINSACELNDYFGVDGYCKAIEVEVQ